MAEMTVRQQEHQSATTLYGDMDALAELAGAIRKVAPWANDPKYPMTDYEVGLVARRSIGMSLDPLNPNEIQIWKDSHGIHFQLAKSLITEWMHHFKGDTTEPRYYRLMAEQLEEEGLTPKHVAYKCTFYMRDDLDKITTLIEAQIDTPSNVRAMFEIWGIGVATPDEWNNAYFAPAGRSKASKVQKRALTDAIVKRFGTPTKAEIEELRRTSGTDRITADDWEGAYEVGADERGTVALAQDAANRRENEPLTREEAKDGVNLLYGNDEVVDGVFNEVETPQNEPQIDDFDGTQFNFDDIEEIPLDKGMPPQQKKELHWIDVPETRRAFWAWCGDHGIDKPMVHTALGVESINDYTGTIGDAKTVLSKL